MRENQTLLIRRLKEALAELIERYERVKEENKNLFKEIQDLKLHIQEKDNQILQLNRKLEDYKLGNAFILAQKGEDISKIRHEAKIKINKLIREITTCINLLKI